MGRYRWRSKTTHPKRFGEPCTLLTSLRGMGASDIAGQVRVRFDDGEEAWVHRSRIVRLD